MFCGRLWQLHAIEVSSINIQKGAQNLNRRGLLLEVEIFFDLNWDISIFEEIHFLKFRRFFRWSF